MRTASARNSACCLRSSGTRPMPWRIASCGERMRDRLAVDEDAAGIERIGAEDRPRHLGAAGADQAGDAEDLAVADRQRDVVEDRRVRVLRVATARKALDRKRDVAGFAASRVGEERARPRGRPSGG